MKLSRKWRRAWERDHSRITGPAGDQAKSGHSFSLLSRQFGKSVSALARAAVVAGLSLSALAVTNFSYALPSGGSIIAGQGQIAQNGNTLTVTQNTDKLSLDWQNFTIGKGEKVQFLQPGAQSIALNRISGNSASAIYGQLSANGKVFLINPNGILFAAGSQVNVGGLVASTLNVSDADFLKGNYTFNGGGTSSTVSNQGNIQTADGGYAVLLGGKVSNEGVILANKGSIALGAVSQATLDFSGDGLINLSIGQASLDAQAINKNLLQADGGLVVMTAGAKDKLLNSVVNNSGVIRAQSLHNQNGVIRLEGNTVTNAGVLDASGRNAAQVGGTVKVLGDSVVLTGASAIDAAGTAGGGTVLIGGAYQGGSGERTAVNTTVANGAVIKADAVTTGNGGQVVIWADNRTEFSGTISAKGGSSAGNGGVVETSGKNTLKIGDTASITTTAAKGMIGSWLLDPSDFTISSTGDMSGQTLSKNLLTTDVTISSNSGQFSGNGDVNVNDTVTWSDHKLTINATRNININAVMAANGKASLNFNPNYGKILCGFNTDGTFKGKVNFSSTGTLKINDVAYTVITSLGTAGSTTGTDLQGMAGNLAGKYVLGADIDAAAAASWNGGNGFTPVGTDGNSKFTGVFDGLGHTISNLKLTSTNSSSPTGLFGYSKGTIRNVGLANMNITATAAVKHTVGGMAGVNEGTVTNSYITGNMNAKLQQDKSSSSDEYVGGLTGFNSGGIADSYSAMNITVSGETAKDSKGAANTGGLAGFNFGTISNSYNKGAVNGSAVTFNTTGGNSNWGMVFGGLAGRNDGTIKESYNAGAISGGARSEVGGLAGFNYPGSILTSYNTGTVNGMGYTGGLAGKNYGTIASSYNTGMISGTGDSAFTGGLVGYNSTQQNQYGTVQISYNTGTVTGPASGSYAYTGGLVGYNSGDSRVRVKTSYNTGTVTGVAGKTGGLAGSNIYNSNISDSYWDTTTSGQNSAVGVESNGATSEDLVGLTTAGAFTKSTYANFNFTTDWFMIDGYTRPFAQAEYSTVITNAHQLQLMAKNTSTAYTLGRDISMAEVNSAGAAGLWRISGTKAADGSYGFAPITIFTGSLDGTGHVINGLTIVQGGANTSAGLFGSTTGLIRNVGVINATVTAAGAGSNAGILAGVNSGLITNSYSSGTVTGGTNSNAGGLVGNNKYLGAYAIGNISDSYSAGAVTGGTGSSVGGLAGSNTGVIRTSYSTGAVNGGSTRGGLVGLNDTDSASGINGSITDSYWNITATGQSTGIGTDQGTSSSVGGLSGAGLKAAASYSGFTFSDGPWRIYEGSSLPLLRVFLTPLVVTAKDITTTYNGSVYNGTPGYTASITGANFGTVSYSGTYKAGKNAGQYTIIPQLTAYAGDQQGYDIQMANGTLTINQRALSVGNVTVTDKVYDGKTTAGLTAGYTLDGVIAGDEAELTLAGEFSDKNAGSNKVVKLVLGGTAADNYSVDTSTLTTTGNITKKNLTVTVAGSNKVYDGKADATVTYSYERIAGDDLTVKGNAAFADKNAGTSKEITVSGLTASGADTGNYTITNPNATATTTGDITARLLTVTVTGVDKVYDGKAAAAVKYGDNRVAGDTLTLTSNNSFDNKNAGNGKSVVVNDLAISGEDAGNYSLAADSLTTFANIAKRDLVVAASGVNKVYNSNRDASVLYSGWVEGDDLTVSGTAAFNDKNAGSGKEVIVNELAISGADAGNYNLMNTTTVTNADIDRRELTVTATGKDKFYNGRKNADVTYSDDRLAGDELTISGITSFEDTIPGIDKPITVSALLITGTDAANYSLVDQTAGTKANILPSDVINTAVKHSNDKAAGQTGQKTSDAAGEHPAHIEIVDTGINQGGLYSRQQP